MDLADLARLGAFDNDGRLAGFDFDDVLSRFDDVSFVDEDFENVGGFDAVADGGKRNRCAHEWGVREERAEIKTFELSSSADSQLYFPSVCSFDWISSRTSPEARASAWR